MVLLEFVGICWDVSQEALGYSFLRGGGFCRRTKGHLEAWSGSLGHTRCGRFSFGVNGAPSGWNGAAWCGTIQGTRISSKKKCNSLVWTRDSFCDWGGNPHTPTQTPWGFVDPLVCQFWVPKFFTVWHQKKSCAAPPTCPPWGSIHFKIPGLDTLVFPRNRNCHLMIRPTPVAVMTFSATGYPGQAARGPDSFPMGGTMRSGPFQPGGPPQR